MQVKQGLEILKQIEDGYRQVEKLYGEFERVTNEQTKVIAKGDITEVIKLVYQRHAVIEQIEARNAVIAEQKDELINGFLTLKKFNMSGLTRTFGQDAVERLSDVMERLGDKIEELLQLDKQNQQLLRGKLINTNRQRQHLQLGKKTLDAYKKKSLIDARFVDKKK